MSRTRKNVPTPAPTPKLDATQYQWRCFSDEPGSLFARFVADDTPKPRSLGEVQFDDASFARCDYRLNGVHWSYYGSGTIYDYAAVQLDNGHVLFCITSGSQFAGTFCSADDIRMQYYELIPIASEGA